ncbi:hypothetical protein ABPG74_018949 [Tetrahymena malaccensis]
MKFEIVDKFLSYQSQLENPELHFSGCNLSGQKLIKVCQKLVSQKNIHTLIFKMRTNNLTHSDLAQLGNRLPNIAHLMNLSIFLSRNCVNDGLIQFAQGLALCKNLTTLMIELEQGNVDDSHMSYLGEGLGKSKSIQHLTVQLKENQIKSEGLTSFAKEVSKIQTLETLNLDFNQNKIGSTSLKKFETSFQESQLLSKLNICFQINNIGQEQIQSLIKGFNSCKNLTCLNLGLWFNHIDNECLEIMGKELTNNKSIKKFYLDIKVQNKVDYDQIGLFKLAKYLAKVKRLYHLELVTQDPFSVELSKQYLSQKHFLQLKKIPRLVTLKYF